MSDGGEDQGDRGRQEDRDDRIDRDVPGKLFERCPGETKAEEGESQTGSLIGDVETGIASVTGAR